MIGFFAYRKMVETKRKVYICDKFFL